MAENKPKKSNDKKKEELDKKIIKILKIKNLILLKQKKTKIVNIMTSMIP